MATEVVKIPVRRLNTLSTTYSGFCRCLWGDYRSPFETAKKRPQTRSNRDDFKFDDGESRSFTIGASGGFKMEKVYPAGADSLLVTARD